MKFVSYNKELRNATAQILDVFDNITITRTAEIGGNPVQKTINVPCVYGPRSRIFKSLENRDKTLKLPISAVSMIGFSWDASRTHSVNSVMEFQDGSAGGINLMHNVATPITITYELGVVAKYMSDLEQILSNFIAIMNPDIYVTWPSPAGNGNLKTHIVWDGNMNIQNAEDISAQNPWRVAASTRFVLKTWIFPGTEPYDSGLDKRIKKINFCDAYEPDYFPVENDQVTPADPSAVSLPVVFSRWYDNRLFTQSMDEFYDMIKRGQIQAPNYDQLKILDELSGSYWLDNIYAILSGDIYDFGTSGDLSALIENEHSPDLIVTTIRDDGSFFTPETLQTSGNWGSIWRRMLSGDLSCIQTAPPSALFKYLIKEENYLFLLYEDRTLIPIIT